MGRQGKHTLRGNPDVPYLLPFFFSSQLFASHQLYACASGSTVLGARFTAMLPSEVMTIRFYEMLGSRKRLLRVSRRWVLNLIIDN